MKDFNGHQIDLTTLTALVTDPELSPAVAELRRLEQSVLDAESKLYDLRVDAALARERAMAAAQEVLREDAGIAYDYAHEAWGDR
jgi:hypothetical protein